MNFDISKHGRKYKLMLDNLELYYPDVLDKIDSWYISGSWELTLKLEDESVWIFDGRENLLRKIEELEDISQEVYTREFSFRLYRRMRDAGYSPESLGEKVNLSKMTIYRYLNGTTIPNGFIIMKLANALKCSPDRLLDIWERR